MPRRTYRRRRRAYPKRRYGRRVNRVKKLVDGHDTTPGYQRAVQNTGSWLSAIPGLISTVGNIVSLINVERKYVDNANIDYPQTTAFPIWQFLTNIAQGDDENTRNGNKVLLQNITCRLYINLVGTQTVGHVRFMLVCDKNYDASNGETFTTILGKILEDTTYPLISPLNKNEGKRFVLMKDKLLTLVAGSDRQSISRKFFMKTPFHVEFDGPLSTDSGNNSVYMIILTDVTGVGNSSTITWYTRTNYTDN